MNRKVKQLGIAKVFLAFKHTKKGESFIKARIRIRNTDLKGPYHEQKYLKPICERLQLSSNKDS
jgi:hypothetical protein